MWLEETKQGLKIYENDKHIKTVPKKFKKVVTRLTFSDDSIRLSREDRLFLEGELFRDTLKNSLTRTDQLIAEQIIGAIADDCIQIDLPEGEWKKGEITIVGNKAVRGKSFFVHKKRFVLLFSNGVELTCNAGLFKLGSGEVKRKIQ